MNPRVKEIQVEQAWGDTTLAMLYNNFFDRNPDLYPGLILFLEEVQEEENAAVDIKIPDFSAIDEYISGFTNTIFLWIARKGLQSTEGRYIVISAKRSNLDNYLLSGPYQDDELSMAWKTILDHLKALHRVFIASYNVESKCLSDQLDFDFPSTKGI
jgi:hypothetical protein